jgi:glycosyltransferase involved in cell wall biosynthesis
MNVSLIIPVLDEEESLPELDAWIQRVMAENKLSYEIIFIDDGSTDKSWQVIGQLRANNPHIRAIKFRRNYGKSAALHSGFQAAKGRVVITMDADLQDSPDEIPELHRMIVEDGLDLVSGWKKKRHDPLSKTIPSKFYNFVVARVSKINLHDFNCGLKAYRNEVVKSVEVYGDMHRYIPLLAKWSGFKKIGEKVVEHRARKYGYSKFGWSRLLTGFLDLLSVVFVGRYGKKPMQFFGVWGVIVFLLGFLFALFISVSKIYHLAVGNKVPLIADNPWFYGALTCMIIGSQLFLAGFIAELISRNAPHRNHYVVQEWLGEFEEEVEGLRS